MNKKHVIGYVATALIAMGIGGASAASDPSTAPVAASSPVPAVTVTVPGPAVTVTVPGPERVVTKTVKVPGPTTNRTPASCLEALDLADQGFSLAGDGMTAASEGFTAVSDFDVDALEAASRKISATGSELSSIAPQYVAAKNACKSAS